ncbi:MAG TPA: carboxylating nicotinate-nucleotide diphosphorylase [Chitinophagaceae bacterium]|jgi:nicotinate-nucleotide pyrophosphorylase (carboxylating)
MINFNEQLHELISRALQEDIGNGDHSTLSCIAADAKGKAILKIKQEGVLAGIEIARQIFLQKEPFANFISFKRDGDEINPGEIGFEVEASVHTILKCERLLLNCMQRMSGIASLTRQYVNRLNGYKTKILDTRKTTPNFRLLEKEAVRIGGGVNHRFGLFDMILLKDNHVDYCGGLENAIERAYHYVYMMRPDLKIEIESRTIDDVKKVVAFGKGKVFRIMLDNFRPLQISEALKIINDEFETEASGGINLENIEEYAKTGVDFISVGGLIHQAKSLDLSLKAQVG